MSKLIAQCNGATDDSIYGSKELRPNQSNEEKRRSSGIYPHGMEVAELTKTTQETKYPVDVGKKSGGEGE